LEADGNPEPPADPAAQFVVYPAHSDLPEGFLAPPPSGEIDERPPCATDRETQCDAYLVDVDGDQRLEVLTTQGYDASRFTLYQLQQGRWRATGSFTLSCSEDVEELRSGRFRFTPARGRDLVIGDHRYTILPPQACSRAQEQGGAVAAPASVSRGRRLTPIVG
jgi:hypothetical protein